MKEAERIEKLLKVFRSEYADAKCSLDFENPFQLLIATILSAQCTDKRVNEVTPRLFQRYPEPAKMAAAPLSELEALIQSTGFFRQKAKSLKKTAEILSQTYESKVPDDLKELVKLPGVGRKTANVVLGNAFGKAAGVVVDTHVGRISRLLGLTRHQNAEKVEQDLNRKIPESDWVEFPHWLIFHGRQICIARRPKCLECPVLSLCPRRGLPRLKTRPAELQMTKKGDLVARNSIKRKAAIPVKNS